MSPEPQRRAKEKENWQLQPGRKLFTVADLRGLLLTTSKGSFPVTSRILAKPAARGKEDVAP